MKSKYGFDTTKERSELMSKIKGKNTKPELLLRKALWRRGIRYRVNDSNLLGKPDISIRKYKLAVFVDGEFWHGFNWEEKKNKIKSNREYWIKKIERNMQRDLEVTSQLRNSGWTVIRFWEKEIKKDVTQCSLIIEKVILNNREKERVDRGFESY